MYLPTLTPYQDGYLVTTTRHLQACIDYTYHTGEYLKICMPPNIIVSVDMFNGGPIKFNHDEHIHITPCSAVNKHWYYIWSVDFTKAWTIHLRGPKQLNKQQAHGSNI